MIKNNIFDTIAGLPVHPLIDHLVVIALPTFSLLTIALVAFPKLRKNYGLVNLAGLAVSVVASFIAKQSGEALALRVGYPTDHAELGENLVLIAALLFALTAVWYFFLSSADYAKKIITKISGIVAALVAVVAIIATVLVGHSGAKATWEKRINPKAESTTSETTNPTGASEASSALTMSEVAKRNTVDNCWAVVDGIVYDLTGYATSHPGGAINIEKLCGTDATSGFNNQHSGETKSVLTGFEIGALGASATTSPQPKSAIPKPTSSAKTSTSLTLAEVAKRNTPADCWAVVSNTVYDLTAYVAAHPGGAANITNLCGTDATQAFSNQHGTAAKPTSALAGFAIGSVGATANALPLPVAVSNGGEENEKEENEGDED
jgi:cytochrome b involved in lipid metabolism